MYSEHTEFYIARLAAAKEHLAETEIVWPATKWVIPFELATARELVAIAEEELADNEEGVRYLAELKADSICDCGCGEAVDF